MTLDFKKIENVLMFLKKDSEWDTVYEHDNALEVALTPQSIDGIFGMITKNTKLPLIYESGCGDGITTDQICGHLSKRGIDKYRLIAHDVRKSLVEFARSRFCNSDNVEVELRSGFDYSNIPNESIDGIFSLNAIVPFLYAYYSLKEDIQAHVDYLRETSRVLKEEKPLILTYLWKALILVKNSKPDRYIPFEVKLYSDHPAIEIFLNILEKRR